MPKSPHTARRFSAQIDEFLLHQVRHRSDDLVKYVATELHAGTQHGSPYGNPTGSPVRTGNFKLNWQLTANPMSLRAGVMWYLLNNTVYGPALEDGHSSQAPDGIVGPLGRNFQQLVDDIVAQMVA